MTFDEYFKSLKAENISIITLKELSTNCEDDQIVTVSCDLMDPSKIEHFDDFCIIHDVGYEGPVVVKYNEIRSIKLQ
jgi:hypothetical protein